MKIKRVFIHGFGRLRDYTLDFDEAFTLLYGCNEAGKTTLLEFILSMLYGFPSTRLQDVRENHRVRYKPWSGGAFGGVLWIRHKGVEYEIWRDFGDRKAQDTTRVMRATTGDELSIGRKEPGEYLLHMTRGEFLNSVFIAQNETAVSSDAEILTKLMRTVSGTEKEVSAKEMEKALSDYRKELENERARKPTVRSELLEKIEALETELREANTREAVRLELSEETERAEASLATLEKKLRAKKERMALGESAQSLERERRLLRLWDELETAKEEAEKTDPSALPDEKTRTSLENALREWNETALRLQSYREDLPKDQPEHLRRQAEELTNESDALAELEKRWDALMDEGRLLVAEREKEERAHEQKRAEYERTQTERGRLEEEIGLRHRRLQEQKQKLADTRDKYEASGKKQGRAAVLLGIGVLLVLAGIFLSVLQGELLWHIATAGGLLLLVYGFMQKKSPRSDASDELVRELERDVLSQEEELEEKQTLLKQMPKATDAGEYRLSSELSRRETEKQEATRQWRESAARLHVTDPEQISALRKDRAARIGILQERENRVTELRLRCRQAEEAEEAAASAFSVLSAPYFVTGNRETAARELSAIKDTGRAYEALQTEIKKMKARIQEEAGDRDKEEVAKSCAELASLLDRKDIPSPDEARRLEEELTALEEETNRAREQVISGQTRLSEAQKNPVIPSTVEYEIQQAKEQLDRLDEEIGAVDTALAVLKESLTEMQESFGPELNRVTAEHLAEMTLEKDVAVSIDRKFEIKITDPVTRGRWERGYFSAGKVDQIYLALRMAIAEVVYKKENADPLPLILDDALDQFDGERGRRTLQKLMRSAKTHGHQVLFASCHERIRDFVTDERGTVVDMDRR